MSGLGQDVSLHSEIMVLHDLPISDQVDGLQPVGMSDLDSSLA